MTDFDTSSPEFQEAVKAAAKEQIESEHAGLLKAIEAEREARKKAEGKLKDYDQVDVSEYQKLKAQAEKLEEEKARAEGDYEKLLEKEREKWKGMITERDDKIQTLTGSLESTLIESAAKSAISAHGGDAELLLPHVTRAAKLIERDGRHTAVVVDDSGEPRLAPDAKTAQDYMGIESLVAGWKENGKYPGAFAGTGMSGGGGHGSGGGSGGGAAPKRVSASDHAALNKYEKEIANGEVVVDFAQ